MSTSRSSSSPATPSTQSSAPIVRCPTCQGPSVFAPSNVYRPFCSERCRQIDLGAWANEEFRVPAQTPPADEAYGDPREQP